MPAVVEYELTPDDYVQFNMHYIRNSPVAQRMRRNSVIALSGGVFAVGIFTWILEKRALPLVFFGIATVLCVLFGSRWWYWETTRRSKRIYAEAAKVRESHNALEIGPDGFRASGNSGEGTYKWPAVDNIVEDTHHTYVYVGMTGLIIPNRAFASEEDRKRFVEMAREYREAAVGLTSVNI